MENETEKGSENEKRVNKGSVDDASSKPRLVISKKEIASEENAESQKESVVIDIEKAVEPKTSGPSSTIPTYDHLNKKLFEYEDEMATPHWAVPWSDIMMVVFVMFAVLFIYTISKRDVAEVFKVPSKTRPEVPKHAGIYEITPESLLQMSKEIAKDTKPAEITVDIQDSRTIRISARDSLFFDLGKADIKPQAVKFLRHLSEVLSKNQFKIRVDGHTDSFPIHNPTFPTNWELSAIRAVNIARFLIEEANIAPERLTITGHSMYKPAVPNTTPDNKVKNRRVEIFITKE
ncbi:MAG: OmpA family protein [Proteobacteria bacterium]|nr:OmpA family protein [Pseudomonadota bacterium]